jgi:transcriptional regulator GlxA family with amidase domain
MLVTCAVLARAGLVDGGRCCRHCHIAGKYAEAACETKVAGVIVSYDLQVCCRVDATVLMDDRAQEVALLVAQGRSPAVQGGCTAELPETAR